MASLSGLGWFPAASLDVIHCMILTLKWRWKQLLNAFTVTQLVSEAYKLCTLDQLNYSIRNYIVFISPASHQTDRHYEGATLESKVSSNFLKSLSFVTSLKLYIILSSFTPFHLLINLLSMRMFSLLTTSSYQLYFHKS